jgi:hypothetical protein
MSNVRRLGQGLWLVKNVKFTSVRRPCCQKRHLLKLTNKENLTLKRYFETIANELKWLAYEQAKCTMWFKQHLMCVYLFVNITRFDLYSVSLCCCFYGGNRGKPRKHTGKIHSCYLRVRSANLADMRMRICYQNNGGSNISKRENSKLWNDRFPNCAPVSLGEQRILIK